MTRGFLRFLRGNTIALLALFLALGGTTYAASAALIGKNTVASPQVVNGSLQTKDLSKKARKALKGNRGPRGLTGARGPTGAQGAQGVQGVQGPPGPLVTTLPAGKTLVGEWSVLEWPTAGGQVYGDSITFQFPLSSAPIAHYIESGAPTPAGCLGSRTNPGASPGNLCVFENETYNAASGTQICNWIANTCSGANRLGFTVVPNSVGSGLMETNGTWAVTAPTGASPTHAASQPHRVGVPTTQTR